MKRAQNPLTGRVKSANEAHKIIIWLLKPLRLETASSLNGKEKSSHDSDRMRSVPCHFFHSMEYGQCRGEKDIPRSQQAHIAKEDKKKLRRFGPFQGGRDGILAILEQTALVTYYGTGGARRGQHWKEVGTRKPARNGSWQDMVPDKPNSSNHSPNTQTLAYFRLADSRRSESRRKLMAALKLRRPGRNHRICVLITDEKGEC